MVTVDPKTKLVLPVKKRGFFFNFWLGTEKEYFMENLAMLLTSGMDILSSIRAVKSEIHSSRMKEIIANIEDEVESGSSLWRALEKSKVISSHIIFLIRLGEETGRLSENLKLVVIQQQKDRELKSRIKSAMIYPVVVLSLTVVVGLGIAWFILPRLATVFSSLRLDLPPITRAMIAAGNFLNAYGSIVVPICLGLAAVLIYLFFFYPKTKFIGQAILFFLPGTKKLIKEVELTRFGYVLGTLLRAGLLVTYAVDSLSKATALKNYQKLYNHLRESIEEGSSFDRAFSEYKNSGRLIPVPVQQMVAASEQSGHLHETLFKIGETFERKTEDTTKNLSIILEPILLVIVWIGVVAVALSVILPIYSLIGGLSN